jgi:GntR family transcriptional regulator of gluconate operon
MGRLRKVIRVLNQQSTAPEPIEQHALGDLVADKLRYRIAQGSYRPDERLVEGALAEQFGVSRGPIRDALRTMEAEGLVYTGRKGAFVKGFTLEDIDELYSLRDAIEQFAVTLLVGRRQQVDWAQFDQQLARMSAAAKKGNNQAFSQADIAFHTQVYLQSNHRRLLDVWYSYEKTFSVVLELSGEKNMDLQASLQDHQALLKALREGPVGKARQATSKHIANAHARMRTSMQL